MKLLAIDTSTDFLSLAIMDEEKVLGRFHKKARQNHSRLLIPMIDKLLKRTKLKLKDIDGFCVSIGPGSFTGLRIGVTTVKGLSFSMKKVIVTVPTLDAIAENAKKFRGIIIPVLDAKKNKVYACIYKSDGRQIKRISKYLLITIKDLLGRIKGPKEKIFFLGDVDGFRGSGVDWHPKAEKIARLGLSKFKRKQFTSPEDLEPLYLYSRECDVTGK